MARHHKEEGDTDDLTDMDNGWTGVDMTTAPDRVDTRKVSWALNYRFRNLEASPRRGIQQMAWATGEEPCLDAIPFASSDEFDWVMRAFADRVVLSRPELEVTIDLPEGVTLDQDISLVQAFNNVYLLRGDDESPLYWQPGTDPADPSNNTFGPVPAAQANRTTIPKTTTAVWRLQRLWVAHSRDVVSPSDINRPYEFDPNNDLNVEKGAHDSIVALHPTGTDLMVLKGDSVHVLENIQSSNLAVTNRELTRDLGAVARRAVTTVGSDIWFLAAEGVMAFSQVLDNSLQGVGMAKTRDVTPMINRANPAALSKAQSTLWDGRYYLALAVDGSATNNAVLVYDTQAEAWQGVDNSAAHDVFRWVKLKYQGKIRLFFVDTKGRLFIYEEGYEDRIGSEYSEIYTELITRGYLCETLEQKVFLEAQLGLSTQRPELQFFTVVNGMYG
jgi:hypothetical protein